MFLWVLTWELVWFSRHSHWIVWAKLSMGERGHKLSHSHCASFKCLLPHRMPTHSLVSAHARSRTRSRRVYRTWKITRCCRALTSAHRFVHLLSTRTVHLQEAYNSMYGKMLTSTVQETSLTFTPYWGKPLSIESFPFCRTYRGAQSTDILKTSKRW